jgi:hypothetical protein
MLLLGEGLVGTCGSETEFEIDVSLFGWSRFHFSIYLMLEYYRTLDEVHVVLAAP